MATITEILKRLAEYTVLYDANRSHPNLGNIGTLSDNTPGLFSSAEVIWAVTCVEKAEIFNQKLILYARQPSFITDTAHISLWNYLQSEIKKEFGVTLAISMWDDDFIPPIEPVPYTLHAWDSLCGYLNSILSAYPGSYYRENLTRILGN
jgi:hypothetical protein